MDDLKELRTEKDLQVAQLPQRGKEYWKIREFRGVWRVVMQYKKQEHVYICIHLPGKVGDFSE